MTRETDVQSFVLAFGEWVEACWFGEQEAAGRRLEVLLALPTAVVLLGAMSVLGRLLEAMGPAGRDDVGAALAHHLIVTGPDPEREMLIRDVVAAAGSAPAERAALLGRHDSGAIAAAALECASFLTQAEAERQGVVPSSILESF
jgi:hypothetical protein